MDGLLAEELGALGAGSGGSPGLTRLMAKLMRKNVHEIDLLVPLPFDDAVSRAVNVLVQAGSERAGRPRPVLRRR